MYATWRIMAFTPQGEVFAEIVRILLLYSRPSFPTPKEKKQRTKSNPPAPPSLLLLFLQQILPSYNITCPTWGGPNFETLYITSASHRGTSEPPQEGDLGGHVYSFTPGIARGGAKGEFAG